MQLQLILLLILVIGLSSFTNNTQENKTETPTVTADFGQLKAAFMGPARKAFFLTDKKCYRLKLSPARLEKKDLIDDAFKGLVNNIDAAILFNNGRSYFFKGSNYYRYSYTTRKIDKTAAISAGWKGVPNNIDAAVLHSNGKVYFFKGDKYYRYNISKKKVDKVALIRKNWKGVPNNIDAALRHSNGKTYFFKGNKYYRYNPSKKKVDKEATIGVDGWQGLSFTKRKKLKITLTKMRVVNSDKKRETIEVLLQQWLLYSINGTNIPDEKTDRLFQKYKLKTHLENNKLAEIDGARSLIFHPWEAIRTSSRDHSLYSQINNVLAFPINNKEIADENAFIKITTNLTCAYLDNVGTVIKLAEWLPIKVKVNEVLQYLENPQAVPSDFFNSDGYHYAGPTGTVMPFKIAEDKSALEGYIEYSNEGIVIRTYYHFELVE